MSDARVTFRITPKLRKAMRRGAQAIGKSEAEFMRRALDNFLESDRNGTRQPAEIAVASGSVLPKRKVVRRRKAAKNV